MTSSPFPDSFDDSLPTTESTHPFLDDDSTFVETSFNNSDSVDDSGFFSNSVEFGSNGVPVENGAFIGSDGPILPPHDDMQEEGFALRDWRRQNAILLEQKEKKEKEILSKIIEEANEFKIAFDEKRITKCANNIVDNREKEKLVLASQEKFHKEASNNYWKSIADLIPNEVPVIKKRGKKENEKKPSVVVIQGPKPGKPTDLARMRQILIKLKHETPAHLKLTPPPDKTGVDKDAKPGVTVDAPPKTETIAVTTETVIAA